MSKVPYIKSKQIHNTFHHIDIKLPIDIKIDILEKYIINIFKVKISLLFGYPQSFINIVGEDIHQVNNAALTIQQIIVDTLMLNMNKKNIKLENILFPKYIE